MMLLLSPVRWAYGDQQRADGVDNDGSILNILGMALPCESTSSSFLFLEEDDEEPIDEDEALGEEGKK